MHRSSMPGKGTNHERPEAPADASASTNHAPRDGIAAHPGSGFGPPPRGYQAGLRLDAVHSSRNGG